MSPEELANFYGWNLVGINPDGSAQFQVIDDDNVGKNFVVDQAGNLSWLPDTPPPSAEIPPPAVVAPPPSFPTFTPHEEEPTPAPVFTPHEQPPPEPPAPQEQWTPLPEDTPPAPWGGQLLPPANAVPQIPDVDTGESPADTPPMPTLSDPNHVYAGSHDGFDWYYVDDVAAGVRTIWPVQPGSPSGNVIWDELYREFINQSPVQTATPTYSDPYTQATAQARGWDLAGHDASGRQQLSVTDIVGNIQTFSVFADGQVDWSTMRITGNVSNPAGGGSGPPVVIPPPASGGGGGSPIVVTPGSGNYTPVVVYTAQMAQANGWTLDGYDSQGRQQMKVIDTAHHVIRFSIDPATGAHIVSTVRDDGLDPNYHPATGGGGTVPPGTTQPTMKSYTHPVTGQTANIDSRWVGPVGTTSKGNPVFQVRDEVGTIVQFFLDRTFSARDGIIVPTLGVYVPMVDNSSTTIPDVLLPGGGGGAGGQNQTVSKNYVGPVLVLAGLGFLAWQAGKGASR